MYLTPVYTAQGFIERGGGGGVDFSPPPPEFGENFFLIIGLIKVEFCDLAA